MGSLGQKAKFKWVIAYHWFAKSNVNLYLPTLFMAGHRFNRPKKPRVMWIHAEQCLSMIHEAKRTRAMWIFACHWYLLSMGVRCPGRSLVSIELSLGVIDNFLSEIFWCCIQGKNNLLTIKCIIRVDYFNLKCSSRFG